MGKTKKRFFGIIFGTVLLFVCVCVFLCSLFVCLSALSVCVSALSVCESVCLLYVERPPFFVVVNFGARVFFVSVLCLISDTTKCIKYRAERPPLFF